MTTNKRWTALIVLLLVATLSGCQLRADVTVDVNDGGGGTLAVTLAADDSLRRAAGAAGADPLQTLADAGRRLPGWRVRRPEGATGAVTLETSFDDPAELERTSTQLAAAIAAPELRPLEPLQLTLTDDTVALRGGAGLQVTSAVREIGYSRARAREAIADSVRLRITARMPGEVLETNADERGDDRTVTWTIPAGEQRQLRVLAARPWTIGRVVRLLITPTGLAAVLLGAVVIVAWWRATRDRPTRDRPTS